MLSYLSTNTTRKNRYCKTLILPQIKINIQYTISGPVGLL
jgi:hypothetical protein